jgi:hypothetical protein
MKKTLMILALAMFSFANAQKGTVLVMGNISFTSQKQENVGYESTSNFVALSPKLGYQFNDNWTVGIESSVENGKTKNTGAESKSNSFSMGSFIRYSKSLGGIFSAYADLGAGFNNRKQNNYVEGSLSQEEHTSSFKTNGFYIGLVPALFVDVKNGFGLNFNIGGLNYNYIKNNVNNATEYKTFNFNFGKAFSIGLSKNF